jgi:DNA-binding transcriptional LysR family regulator
MSFTLAADDLCLTQSAVSRQVRTLERMLDVKLLVRGHRSISFTTEGERLFRSANEVVKQLQEVIGAIKIGSSARPVTITSSIGVTGLWLLPRLGSFLQRHPNIDVRISAGNAMSDLCNDGLDLPIRYCAPVTVPAGATRLFGETVTPVAHPFPGLSAFRNPRDLEAQTLLEFDHELRDWRRESSRGVAGPLLGPGIFLRRDCGHGLLRRDNRLHERCRQLNPIITHGSALFRHPKAQAEKFCAQVGATLIEVDGGEAKLICGRSIVDGVVYEDRSADVEVAPANEEFEDFCVRLNKSRIT